MKTEKLLDGVTASGAGSSVSLNNRSVNNMCQYPIILRGLSGDTVELEVSADNTNFVPLEGGEFTNDIATVLVCPFPYIRANVTTYGAGNITVEIGNV